ncbi:hypothetical protein D3C87_1083620 [compost metagenome]
MAEALPEGRAFPLVLGLEDDAVALLIAVRVEQIAGSVRRTVIHQNDFLAKINRLHACQQFGQALPLIEHGDDDGEQRGQFFLHGAFVPKPS